LGTAYLAFAGQKIFFGGVNAYDLPYLRAGDMLHVTIEVVQPSGNVYDGILAPFQFTGYNNLQIEWGGVSLWTGAVANPYSVILYGIFTVTGIDTTPWVTVDCPTVGGFDTINTTIVATYATKRLA